MVPTCSKYSPDVVLKSRHSVDLGHRPNWLSLENCSALSGLEVKLGQIWSQHGPDMVLKSKNSVDIGLRSCWLSLNNCKALSGLEVKLGQTWSQDGLNKALTLSQKIQNYKVLFCWSFKCLQSKFDTLQTSRSKDTVEIVKTWPFYGSNMGLTWSS